MYIYTIIIVKVYLVILLLSSTFVLMVQLHGDAIQPVWRQKALDTRFDDYQWIEGPGAKKGMSHETEQMIFGWRKIKAICWMRKEFNS